MQSLAGFACYKGPEWYTKQVQQRPGFLTHAPHTRPGKAYCFPGGAAVHRSAGGKCVLWAEITCGSGLCEFEVSLSTSATFSVVFSFEAVAIKRLHITAMPD